MAYIQPHHSCLHPHKVVNRYTGDILTVSCGTCAACLLQRQIKCSTLCEIEAKKYKYVHFVTLTYNKEFVPRFSISTQLADGTKYSNGDTIVYYDCQSPRLQKYYPTTLCHVVANKDIFIANDLLFKRTRTDGYLNMLSKIDLQLFLKRFRKYLSKYTNEKIRYYAVGEYGPQTFRPHYHLLFFSNSEKTSCRVQYCVNKAWTAYTDNNGQTSDSPRKIGFTSTSLVTSSAPSYVAGYVSSNMHLPRLYSVRTLRPFAVHSAYFGWPTSEKAHQEIYDLQPAEFIRRSIESNGKIRIVQPPVSMEHAYFPKTYRFARADYDELYNYYTLFATASRFLPPSDFTTTEVVANLFDLSRQPLKASLHGLRYLCGLTEQQITSIYYISKHFINFCCAGELGRIPLRLQQLIEYHRFKQLYILGKYYEKMENYYCSSSLAQVADTIDFWFDYVVHQRNERPIRHSNKSKHWTYMNYRSYCEDELHKHTKHKALNDLNKVFDNPLNSGNYD